MYEEDGMQGAAMLRRIAAEVEQAWEAWLLEELTVAEAAAESHYSEQHLRSLLSDGRLENAGEAGAPRIRRCQLPRKVTEPDGPRLELVDAVLEDRQR